MSGIRGKNTAPEMYVRSALHRKGFRFRLHASELPGKPDIVLPRYKAVFLVHGCFWHGHDCALFRLPKTRPEFWASKLQRNRMNDERAIDNLASIGWRVGVIWECSIRGANALDQDGLGSKLADWLRSKETMLSVSSTIAGCKK